MNIGYPFAFNGQGRTSTIGYETHIHDMIEQLLFTNPGERVNRPDFGSGLLYMIFAPNSSELASTLQFSLQAALNQWIGDLIEVQAVRVSSEEATLSVLVQYLIRSSGERRIETFERSGLP